MHSYSLDKPSLCFKKSDSFSVMTAFFFFSLTVGAALYRKLKAYLMTEEQLQEHGYPRPNPEASGKAIIYNLPEKKATVDGESPCSFSLHINNILLDIVAQSYSNLLLTFFCVSLQHLTRYAVDAAQSIRSTSTAAVYGKRNVASIGGDYADIKVGLQTLLNISISIINVLLVFIFVF